MTAWSEPFHAQTAIQKDYAALTCILLSNNISNIYWFVKTKPTKGRLAHNHTTVLVSAHNYFYSSTRQHCLNKSLKGFICFADVWSRDQTFTLQNRHNTTKLRLPSMSWLIHFDAGLMWI